MKVLILGGYGVFGGRLARLLLADGHRVLVAGRCEERARRFCAAHGGEALRLARDGDLSAVARVAPDVLVDAAGPFQAYGDDPYRLARAALAAGAHYLDLSDDADFTAGITAVDGEARAAGRVALAGVSSVPALSSAAVAELAHGLEAISVIDTVIVPGNRAPRGPSVLAAILSQAGTRMSVWRGGKWRTMTAWCGSATVTVAPDLHRLATFIGAPDVTLFPDHFAARSVLFRAGLELPVLHHGLAMLSRLRRAGLLPDLRRLQPALSRIAAWLEPFGSDRGAMVVAVTGPTPGGEVERRRWTLIAQAGDGPFVPAVPARAVLRHLEQLTTGARPCLAELPLTAFEEALCGLRVTTGRADNPCPSLFRAALGDAWHQLPAPLRRLHEIHDIEDFSGRARVTRGSSPIARLVAALLGFPRAAADVPLSVTKTRTSRGETWQRDFGGQRFRSHLTPAAPGCVRERFGVLTFELCPAVVAGTVRMPVSRGWFLGLPIPTGLLPVSDTREFVRDGRFHFDVSLLAPLQAGLIVHYCGWLRADADGTR